MIRSLSNSPRSLLLGVAIGALGLIVMGQMPVDIRERVRVEHGPHPRDMVQIREGTPYVVPAGKLFVRTGLGTTTSPGGGADAQLRVNGQVEAMTWIPYSSSPEYSGASLVVPVPNGFTAGTGTTVDVVGGSFANPNDARAWGYLVRQ